MSDPQDPQKSQAWLHIQSTSLQGRQETQFSEDKSSEEGFHCQPPHTQTHTYACSQTHIYNAYKMIWLDLQGLASKLGHLHTIQFDMPFWWYLRSFSCCHNATSNSKQKGFIWLRDSRSLFIIVVKTKQRRLVSANYITSTVRSREWWVSERASEWVSEWMNGCLQVLGLHSLLFYSSVSPA